MMSVKKKLISASHTDIAAALRGIQIELIKIIQISEEGTE